MQYFADVLLPLALGKPYTYAVTSEDYATLAPGFRVAVSFGKSKVYSAVVVKLHDQAPQRYTPKFIELGVLFKTFGGGVVTREFVIKIF